MNEIILNIHPLEKRLAILEDSRLMELFVETQDKENIVGNIYKGTVKDILPGMGAAFIDIGLDRTAFLHYSDIVTDFFDLTETETKVKEVSAQESSKINELLTKGQEIIVQVQKGPINRKGARLNGQISIPGKYLVLFPNKAKIALSRKISSSAEKQRIKGILNQIKDKNVGLIVRTEAEGISEEDFLIEYQGLYKSWKLVEQKINIAPTPSCIYDENDMASKLIRDYFSSEVDRLVVDDKVFMKDLISELKDVAPDLVSRIELYEEDSPIFDAFGIEREIQKIFHSHIPLPSGGNIAIEQTEAFVAVDVNTGSYTGSKDYNTTIRKTNIEAAIELARQLRLRDLSGMVIVDFIDMGSDAHKAEVFDILKKNLKKDRAKTKAFYFGPLGLVELTRKRTGPGLLNTYSEHCQCCNGTGRVLSREAVAMKIHRSLERAEYYVHNKPITLVIHPVIKKYLEGYPQFFKGIKPRVIVEEDEKISAETYRIFYDDKKKELTIVYSA
ncbi:MAG: Rne/Rng family ribonuclease [Candidatus Cloacimonetes bacterium]|nr:Rne/Rng family ribonuclease [Candidatus Cloacimonadota bacterium]